MNLSYLVLMMAFFMKQVVLERQVRIDLQCMEVEVVLFVGSLDEGCRQSTVLFIHVLI